MTKAPDYSIVPDKYHRFLKKCFDKKRINRFADTTEMINAFDETESPEQLIQEYITQIKVLEGQLEVLKEQLSNSPNVQGDYIHIVARDVALAKDQAEAKLEKLKHEYPSGNVSAAPETKSVDELKHTENESRKSITNSIGMEFSYIPPGTFMMGSSEGEEGRYDDETQHKVILTKDFYMQTTEVTVGQWRIFWETGFRSEAEKGNGVYGWTGSKWEMNKEFYWDNPGFSQTDTHPVTCISWNDAQAFLKWLNQKESREYRLSSEAEWEYACRGGTETRYHLGNTEAALGRAGWYVGNSDNRTHPVGKKELNAFGLHDMHGNVWEWCQDWYGNYPSGAVTDPTGPGTGSSRVVRGGSWGFNARGCRSASRSRSLPGFRLSDLGFRLVLLPGRQETGR